MFELATGIKVFMFSLFFLLLGLFAFLRIGNLLPKSKFCWDPHFTLLRHDLSISSKSMDITLRWAKSRRSHSTVSCVKVPRLPSHPLCSVTSVERLLHSIFIPPSVACFVYLLRGNLVSITQAQVRVIHKQLCAQFHDFKFTIFAGLVYRY